MEFIRAELLLQSMQEGSKAGKERKRDMKQFLKRTIAGAACLAMALLFAGSASAKGDIFTQRQILADEDCICGVIFLGYVDGEKYLADDAEYRRQVLENSGYTEEFEFLTEIPSDRIVETDWGAELYCIYPRRADAVVAVNACGYEESEENGYDLVIGEMMFESRSGAPFLLRCNISDIMNDCQVSIFNPDGTVLNWSPSISLNDGSVVLPQEGPAVYDASRKPETDYGGTDYGDTDYGNTDYGDTDYGNTDYGDTDYGDMNDGDIDHDRYDNGTIWHWSLTDGWEVYPTPDAGLLSYQEVAGDGNTILLDCSIADRRIVASRSFEADGEILRVGCYEYETDPVWGYCTSVNYVTELTATEAFLGGTAQNPAVMIQNTDQGLYKVNIWTGEVEWIIPAKELQMSGCISYVVDDSTGMIYMCGYYGPDPVAISPDGDIRWRADADNDDIYWPYHLSLENGVVVTRYGGYCEYGEFVVAYRQSDGKNEWMDIW